MRALVLVFALLAAAATPVAADDENPYRNREYDKLPGPMVYPAGEEPAWRPRMLEKLEAPRSPRMLDEYLLFRDANGPTYLVTRWHAVETFVKFLEIHRIEKREAPVPPPHSSMGFPSAALALSSRRATTFLATACRLFSSIWQPVAR